jgi:hypothetical protein
MFAYNPQVTDRSGEFLAAGRLGAAQSNAQMIEQLGEDIGGTIRKAGSAVAGFAMGGPAGAAMAMQGGGGEGRSGGGGGGSILESIVGAYAQKEQDKSDSKIYGNLMKIVAPAFGDDGDAILEQWNGLESDREKARFGSTLFSSLGQISNMYMANRNAGIRENAPFVGAGLKNAANIAGGNATYAPPADMAPVEPPLPTGGPAPADVAPAPVASGIPGGQASLDAINADRKRRGLPPIQ